MKRDLSTPALVGVIAAVVVLVLGVGWYFLFRDDSHVAAYAGQHGARPMGGASGVRQVLSSKAPGGRGE